MSIIIYSPTETNFSTFGLGVLTPIDATVEWMAGSKYEATVVQPIDDTNRWAQLQIGCVLKIPVPVRESPLYEYIDNPSQNKTITRNVWTVTGTSTGLRLRSGWGTGTRSLGTYKDGVKMVELERQTIDGRLWIHGTLRDNGATGYMSTKYLTQINGETITETISGGRPSNKNAIKVQPSSYQLFRAYAVEQDSGAGIVTAKERHIFYDLIGNLWNEKYEANNENAADVVNRMVAHLAESTPFQFHTNGLTQGKITATYDHVNPVEALLDPDDGIVAQANCQIIIDNFDVYLIDNIVSDMGVTVRRGKNLVGVAVENDSSDIVTKIKPCGKDVEGNDLWLTDSEGSGRFVSSSTSHVVERIIKKDYDVKIVEKDPDNVKTFPNTSAGISAARAKLRELAEDDFESGIDLNEYRMDVDFQPLQDVSDIEDYAVLQAVFPYDTVTVYDTMIGVTAKIRLTGYDWDPICKRYKSVMLGDIQDLKTTYSYNLPTGGIKGTKIANGTADGSILRNFSVQYAKIAVAAIGQLSADALTAHKAYINELTAQSITTDTLVAAYAHLFQIVSTNIQTGRLDADTLTATMASLTNATIDRASINYAKIVDASIEQLITKDAVADRYYIDKLMVRNLQVVEQTVGSLIVKASNGNYYRLDIDAETATVTPTQVSVTAGEIAAGVTDDGHRSIIETDLTVTDLGATSIKAINALIDRITADRIDVDTLVARQAFIDTLTTRQIIGNKTLTMYVNDQMQIGTRNLLLESDKEVESTDYLIEQYTPSEPLTVGEEYTFSVKFTPATDLTDLQLYVSNGYKKIAQITIPSTERGTTVTKSVTFTMPEYYAGRTPDDDIKNADIRLYKQENVVTSNATEIEWVKIESGNKATGWSPAPEDFETDIDALNNAISDDVVQKDDVNWRKWESVQTAVQVESDGLHIYPMTEENGVDKTGFSTAITDSSYKIVNAKGTATQTRYPWVASGSNDGMQLIGPLAIYSDDSGNVIFAPRSTVNEGA